MMQIKILEGTYKIRGRDVDLSGMVFPLVEKFKVGAKGGYVTVDGKAVQGFPDRAIKIMCSGEHAYEDAGKAKSTKREETDEETIERMRKAEAEAAQDATSEAVDKIEDAASAETLTEAERQTLTEALTEVEKKPGPWSGDFAFGFLSTTGSSEATTYNNKLGLIYSVERFKNDFAFNAIYGEQEGVRSVERYAVTDQLDYNVNVRDFAFVALDFEKDLFGSIRERTSQTVGYGRRLFRGPVHTLNVSAGGGSRQQLPQDGGGREYDFIARFSADYLWKITETSSFSQKFRLETGVENTFTEAISELKLNIIGNVSTNISFTARDNSVTSFDSQRTDTFTAVNLGYQFGK